jgi:hypothetical protein
MTSCRVRNVYCESVLNFASSAGTSFVQKFVVEIYFISLSTRRISRAPSSKTESGGRSIVEK